MILFSIILLILSASLFVYAKNLSAAVFMSTLVILQLIIFSINQQGQPRSSVFTTILGPQIEKAEILWYAVDEADEVIYVLLYSPELSDQPRYIYYPYSHKMSEQLAGEFREAAENSTSVEIFNPFRSEGSPTDDMEIHAKPIEADPEKNSVE